MNCRPSSHLCYRTGHPRFGSRVSLNRIIRFPVFAIPPLVPSAVRNLRRHPSLGRNVLVTEKAVPPTARLTDNHVCPMVTGVVPHGGGPILPPCEPTVMIGD